MHDNQLLEQQLQQQEVDHQQTIRMLQDQIQLKEKKLASELAEIENSYRESEHMLKEQLEEKTSIIQVQYCTAMGNSSSSDMPKSQ